MVNFLIKALNGSRGNYAIERNKLLRYDGDLDNEKREILKDLLPGKYKILGTSILWVKINK